MPQMNFANFRGAVPRFQNYAAVAEQGVLFITPEANVLPRRYDPFEDSEGLLLDVVRAGAAVAGCDTFMDYCLSHKMLPLRDAEFWRDGDFFTARPECLTRFWPLSGVMASRSGSKIPSSLQAIPPGTNNGLWRFILARMMAVMIWYTLPITRPSNGLAAVPGPSLSVRWPSCC